MQKDSKIFVAGGTGMVGSAIIRKLIETGYTNILSSCHSRQPDLRLWRPRSRATGHATPVTVTLDLIRQKAVEAFFETAKPEYVVLASAKVGGIHANDTLRADFIYQNLMIQANIIHAAYTHGVKKLLFLGSSCIYPKLAVQPMAEDALLTGPLEPTNEPYAIAKIAGIRLCDAYNRQYGTNFIAAMPTNLYGPGDNYDLASSHVLPALIRRFHLAKLAAAGNWDAVALDENRHGPIPEDFRADLSALSDRSAASGAPVPRVRLWGSGNPLREFLYSDDLARACVFLLENIDYKAIAFKDASGTIQAHINIGSGHEIRIRDLAERIRQVVGVQSKPFFDDAKPDGTLRKFMDSNRLRQLGWRPEIGLEKGIERAYQDFLARP